MQCEFNNVKSSLLESIRKSKVFVCVLFFTDFRRRLQKKAQNISVSFAMPISFLSVCMHMINY
jgi:hypothetical protein